MPSRTDAWLWDALTAARSAHSFVVSLSRDEYLASPLHRSAVERQLEILGEALVRIRRGDPSLSERIPNLSRVIGMRNILAHEYAHVDDALVYEVATDHLPKLIQVLSSLLGDR